MAGARRPCSVLFPAEPPRILPPCSRGRPFARDASKTERTDAVPEVLRPFMGKDTIGG